MFAENELRGQPPYQTQGHQLRCSLRDVRLTPSTLEGKVPRRRRHKRGGLEAADTVLQGQGRVM